MRTRNESFWSGYFGSHQRKGPPLAAVPHSNTVHTENICGLDKIEETSKNYIEKITTHSNESFMNASSDLFIGRMQGNKYFKRKLTKLNKPL